MYRLYEDLAHRYDWHTPAEHYEDDRRFVLEAARAHGPGCSLLDVGCGTGMLVAAARRAGVDAAGLDAAAGMVRVARDRVGADAVKLGRMQDIDVSSAFDVVCALSWTLNYCIDDAELADVLRRLHRALRPGGELLAQLAHAPNATGELFEDREVGPQGTEDDVVFLYRFTSAPGEPPSLLADYVYASRSQNELAFETHTLHVADAHLAASLAREVGFEEVELFDSYRRDPLATSAMPWLLARKAR